MASRKADSTLTPRADAARARRGRELIEYDEFIEVQIEKTRRQVKGVEVLGAVLFWLAGAILYLLLVVLIDHWLVGGGLGFAGRMLALLGFLAGTGAWLYGVLLPPLVGRVNPVYAAQTIEQHEPSLKNSLINFLLLRGERTSVAPVVFAAIEQRAAADLSHVPVDTVVDRGRVIRLGYVLMVVVAMFALYVLLSPKDPLRSVRRILAPWSNLTAPTRVTIDDVQPGSIKAFHHDVIEVSAMVQGVREDETVTLYYSTADGQTVDRPIRMELPTGSYRYRASLPESAAGLLQSLSYYVAAGDVRTPIFEIEVLTAPAILVEAVSYEFPAYTGFGTRRIERVGDIAGIEGTQITIEAKANREIDAAYLDFDCNGTRDLKLSVSGRTARTTFELKRDSEGKPEYGSYQLIFVDDAGRQNPQPIRHRIEVTSDQAPLVEIVLPQSDELEVPLNGAVTIGVRAIDPDFALRSVTLFAVRGNDELVREPLLNERHAGEFRGSWLMDVVKLRPLEPGKPALAAGETIHYWAEARDVRQPLANRSETVRFRLKLISPGGEAEREEQLAQAEQEQEEFAQDRSRADEEGGDEGPLEDRLAAREQTRDQAEESASTDESAESAEGSRVDPEQNAGQAFEEVLKHRQQQAERRQQESPKPSESKSPEEQSPRSSEEEQAPQPEAGEEQRPVEEQPGVVRSAVGNQKIHLLRANNRGPPSRESLAWRVPVASHRPTRRVASRAKLVRAHPSRVSRVRTAMGRAKIRRPSRM